VQQANQQAPTIAIESSEFKGLIDNDGVVWIIEVESGRKEREKGKKGAKGKKGEKGEKGE
jgi:hypothetical protein